jgi:hypothetical protein
MSSHLQKRRGGFFAPRNNNGQSTALTSLKNERDFNAEVIQAELYILSTAQTGITIAVNHGNYCAGAVPEAAEYVRGFERITAAKIAGVVARFGQ